MQYGICNLGTIPVRSEPIVDGRLISQLLYGECFSILESRQHWSMIQTTTDSFEGWIDNKQFLPLSKETYQNLVAEERVLSTDLMELVADQHENLMAIPLGSVLNGLPVLGHHYEGSFRKSTVQKENLIDTALLYLNAPFFTGGRTPFGIDSSGFTQMVYSINGKELPRELLGQTTQGEALSFIEESEPGDLVFFDDPEGNIIHVGIIMANNYIIHAYGKVRIDRIDHSGIYNAELDRHTHQLRVIKKIL